MNMFPFLVCTPGKTKFGREPAVADWTALLCNQLATASRHHTTHLCNLLCYCFFWVIPFQWPRHASTPRIKKNTKCVLWGRVCANQCMFSRSKDVLAKQPINKLSNVPVRHATNQSIHLSSPISFYRLWNFCHPAFQSSNCTHRQYAQRMRTPPVLNFPVLGIHQGAGAFQQRLRGRFPLSLGRLHWSWHQTGWNP